MTASRDVSCPFCQSVETEISSMFGQQLLTMEYYCKDCRTPFQRIKSSSAISDARSQAENNTYGIEVSRWKEKSDRV